MFRQVLRLQNIAIGYENSYRTINTTSVCFAEPLKKKKALNPLTTKKQLERKVRRLEREIAQLESAKPKLKPILELHLEPHIRRDLSIRTRKETDEVAVKLLNSYHRVWSIYKSLEANTEIEHIRECVKVQEKALNVLKRDYPDLYEEAVQLDPDMIPYRIQNPKKETPPIENFKCSDGKEQDVTKEWKL